MAGLAEDTSTINDTVKNLSINNANESTSEDVTNEFEPHLSGFEIRELYKIALNFYKEKEGKAVHLSYEDKLKLIAFTQQAIHGKCTPENSPPFGVLDVIGRDRRLAWQNLGDITKEQAMEGFVVLLDKLCPLFRTVVEAQKRNIEEQKRLKEEEEKRKSEEEKKAKELEEEKKREAEERQRREYQRRQIQEALNQQTYYQFKAYAEQQYPGNPEQQGVLIRQLQEQHYHRYMQQLHQNRLMIAENIEHQVEIKKRPADNNNKITKNKETEKKEEVEVEEVAVEAVEKKNVNHKKKSSSNINNNGDDDDEDDEEDRDHDDDDEDSDEQPDYPHIEPAKMWTTPGVEEFKNTIRREAGDAIIKISHGETVTVRVPTYEDGSCLFWEFATDGYDIGFGVYFEWSKPETNQVSVHISESDDDDDENDDYDGRDDIESGGINGESRTEYKSSVVPISEIIPVYRRDSQEEIYAGSHQYPGQGVYLLKFDNSYSLWRSKTLYYRVYCTRPDYSVDNNPS